MARPPLTVRTDPEALAAFEVLRDGVPPGLKETLVAFVSTHFWAYERGYHMNRSSAPLAQLERAMNQSIIRRHDGFQKQMRENTNLLLNTTDFVLEHLAPNPDGSMPRRATALSTDLEEARSRYTVGCDAEGRYELQDRQSQQLTDLMQQAMTTGGRAADHLRRAWSRVFGRERDLNGACDDSVRAVEVAGKPVVSPRNERTTLGTMIADMKNKPDKWETSSSADNDVEGVIAMMELVWKGHYRHGDESQPIDVTREGAVMVVHVSTVLVEWFKAGHIRLRAQPATP